MSMTADELTATLGTLWPGAHVQRSRDPHAVACYGMVPSPRGPRMLVPGDHPRSAARALLQFSDDSRPRDVALRSVAAGWVRAGGTRRLDRLWVVGDDTASICARLSDLLGTPVRFSISLGSARVNGKPVLRVFDQRGRTLAFAKLGVTPTSRLDVAAEAAALTRLAAHEWTTFEVPRVIHHGPWRDLDLLLVTPLRTAPSLARARLAVPPFAAMRELDAAYRGAVPLGAAPWLAQTFRVADTLAARRDGELLARCLDVLVDVAGDEPLPLGAWHGDWTPWNMATGPRRRSPVQVWDWERFETGVPSGLDPLHFLVNRATRAHGATHGTVLRALRSSITVPGPGGAQVGADRSWLRAGLYLAAIAARYLPLAEGSRGAAIAPRSRVVLGALATWTEVPQPRGSRGDPTAASR